MTGGPSEAPDDRAAYCARVLAGLEQIARDGNLHMLAYLIGVAREEAEARVMPPR